MEKGKLGLRICFYTVLAFLIVGIGGSMMILFLLAGILLLVEKNEWGVRQLIQAIALDLVTSVVYSVLGAFDFIYKIPFIGTAWGGIHSLISSILAIVVFALCIVGILKNLKGEDAAIPIARKFADWAYGVTAQKNVTPSAPAQSKAEVPADKTEA